MYKDWRGGMQMKASFSIFYLFHITHLCIRYLYITERAESSLSYIHIVFHENVIPKKYMPFSTN